MSKDYIGHPMAKPKKNELVMVWNWIDENGNYAVAITRNSKRTLLDKMKED